MATKTPPDELWDAERLATYLEVPRSYVYRLTSERRIRHHRAGKELHFDPADAAAWLAAEVVERAPKPRRTQWRPR